ncbi:MAG: SMC-Scp complex subunit ScpB [Acidobacteriota bacterium]
MPDPPSPPQDRKDLHTIVEALIFACEEPLTIDDLADLFPKETRDGLEEALEEVGRSYAEARRGLQVVRVAGGYAITTRPDLGGWVRALFRSRNRRRLSAAALETLAIIAYRQPITTPEIQALRGIDPSGVLQNLLDKKLVRVRGRKTVVGKPILYGTTREFLTHFGLNSLEDLPSVEEFGELAGLGPAPAVSSTQPEGEISIQAAASERSPGTQESDDETTAEETQDGADDAL